jgi:hypothetical protein
MIHILHHRRLDRTAGFAPVFRFLLLGVRDEQGELRYVGRVASGFTDAQLGLIWKQLRALKTKSSPFPVVPIQSSAPLGQAEARRSGAVLRLDKRRPSSSSGVRGLEASVKARGQGCQTRAREQRAAFSRC